MEDEEIGFFQAGTDPQVIIKKDNYEGYGMEVGLPTIVVDAVRV